MKKVFCGLLTAFSMYSAIPVPKVEWDGDTIKYTMMFFPLIGVVIGAAVYGWAILTRALSPLLFAAGIVLIPVIISGAIHADGFIDTGDAIYSRLDMEEKHRILKDPHVGAFGVILACCWLLASAGAASVIELRYIGVLAAAYTATRAISAFSVVTLKKAKDTGLVHMFADAAQEKAVRISSIIYAALSFGFMIWSSPAVGGALAAVLLLWFWRFSAMSRKKFGGITGDLCGYLVTVGEFLAVAVTAAGGVLL